MPSRRLASLASVASLAPLFLAACSSSAPGTKARADAALAGRLETIRAARGVPGLGAAVVREGRIAVAVTGRRRVDRDGPIRDADAFHLGSDTKAMTASIVARLVERGRLRWDETVAEALPEAAPRMDPAFRGVTLEMLLRHTAGLPSEGAFTPEFTQGFDDENWSVRRQRAWMAERFLSRPPATPPGTRFAYSNYGYIVLGAVVEAAAGKPWEDLMREEVFAPLAPPDKGIALGWGVSNGYNVAEIVVIPRLRAAALVVCNAGDDRAKAAAKEAVDAITADLTGAAGPPGPAR